MPVETSLTIDVSAFEALLDRIEAGLEDGLFAGVHAGGAQVQEDARLRCPVLNGPLRASIRLDGPHVVGRSIEARVVAGEGLAYARVQHDRTDYQHTVGEARFLTNAVDAMRDRVISDIRAEFQRVIS